MRKQSWIVALAAVLMLSGCAWGQWEGNAGRTNWSASPGDITPQNISTLHYLWQPSDFTLISALDNDFAYAVTPASRGVAPELHAYSAAGNENCSGTPRLCSAVWRAALSSDAYMAGGPYASLAAVDGHYVYVAVEQSGRWRLLVFDRTGHQGCTTAVPRTCTPLGSSVLLADHQDSEAGLTLAGGNVYWTSWSSTVPIVSTTVGVHAAGLVGCEGTAACAPFMTIRTDSIASFPTVADGRIYVRTSGGAGIYDANGRQNCSGGICSAMAFLEFFSSQQNVSVGSGRVFVVDGGTLKAFDATGVSGCSQPPILCHPMWTADLGGGGGNPFPPMVTDKVVLVPPTGTDGATKVQAFDVNGISGCNQGTHVCAALWHVDMPFSTGSVVGGGNVGLAASPGIGGAPETIVAFRLDGVGCDSGTRACPPLLSRSGLQGDPNAVAFGRVVLSSPVSQVYAVG